ISAEAGRHAGDDAPARLAAEIDAVGGKAWLMDDLGAARRCLSQLIEATQPRTALCWEHPLLDALDVRKALSAAGAQSLSHGELSSLSPEARRAAMLAADLGISAADWAIAE